MQGTGLGSLLVQKIRRMTINISVECRYICTYTADPPGFEPGSRGPKPLRISRLPHGP